MEKDKKPTIAQNDAGDYGINSKQYRVNKDGFQHEGVSKKRGDAVRMTAEQAKTHIANGDISEDASTGGSSTGRVDDTDKNRNR